MELDTPAKVVFLAGAGRSGSTLLSELLGQSDQFVTVGELEKLPSFGLEKNDPCTCGKLFRSCPFWREVLVTLGGETKVSSLRQWRSSLRLRDLPHLWTRFVFSKERAHALEQLADTWATLLRAITVVSKAQWIVDSSKIPTLVHLLAADKRFDFRVIHLVRDSRAVSYSYARQKLTRTSSGVDRPITSKTPIRAAIAWLRWNLLIELARARGFAILRLRYEDLIVSPQDTLARVGDFLGHPMPHDTINSSVVQLPTSHSIGGNPARFNRQDVRLRIDDEWRARMPLAIKLLITLLTCPLLVTYGYL